MSETIRVSKETKEALLRVAARIQGRTGRRVDFDEAIAQLVRESGGPGSFERFVGSVKGAGAETLLDELRKERSADEQRASRKYGV